MSVVRATSGVLAAAAALGLCWGAAHAGQEPAVTRFPNLIVGFDTSVTMMVESNCESCHPDGSGGAFWSDDIEGSFAYGSLTIGAANEDENECQSCHVDGTGGVHLSNDILETFENSYVGLDPFDAVSYERVDPETGAFAGVYLGGGFLTMVQSESDTTVELKADSSSPCRYQWVIDTAWADGEDLLLVTDDLSEARLFHRHNAVEPDQDPVLACNACLDASCCTDLTCEVDGDAGRVCWPEN